MKPILRNAIITGGTLNFFLALFHLFLCYQISIAYGSMPVYPLLQALAVGGTLMVFFLAYTSLFNLQELVSTKTGTAVIALNILVYLTRTLAEFILFPRPGIAIILLCSLLTLLYSFILIVQRSR